MKFALTIGNYHSSSNKGKNVFLGYSYICSYKLTHIRIRLTNYNLYWKNQLVTLYQSGKVYENKFISQDTTWAHMGPTFYVELFCIKPVQTIS